MKIIINLLVIIFIIVLQWAVLPFCGLGMLLPPLILPVALAWAETGRETEAIIWGSGTLLVMDMIFSQKGIMAISSILAFLLAYFGIRMILHIKGRPFVLACVFLSSLFYFVFSFILISFNDINVWSAFAQTLLPSLFLSIIFWMIFPMLQRSVRLIEIWEAGHKSFLK